MEKFVVEKHPLHLKDTELQKTTEVESAVEQVNRERRLAQERNEELRSLGHEGPREFAKKVPNDPSARIEAYMDRLENIFLNPDERTRERNLELFRDKIYDALIIKPENFPESYFELQQRIARERGQAVEEIPQNVREQMMDVAIKDQKASLDAWMDYLTSDDAVYPAWFKYFVWNNVIKLSQFDKERGEFKTRTDSTVAPFPDIYREPLAQIADIYEQVKEDNKSLKEPEIKEAFSKKFPSLYAELIQKSLAASIENKEQTKGEWVKYEQGRDGDAEKLFKSLEGKGTGWCTAGHSTAEAQIESGDFYVYYTNDAQGNPIQPRLAIRMDGEDKIGEVRGILPQQNVEPIMQEVLDSKLQEFGSEADTYRQKSEDMKTLTAIDNKTQKGEELTKDDLIFLYEIHHKIQGYGYERDPRIKELRAQRNPEADMPIVFDCTPEQIAHSVTELSEDTKAYVGPLEPGIFNKLPETLEHVYTRFPEGKIRFKDIVLGGKNAEQLQQEIAAADMKVYSYAKGMMNNSDFIVGQDQADAALAILSVESLGFPRGATRQEIYDRARELGLEICPAEVGPQLRLQYSDQPMDEYVLVGMQPIADSDGYPRVFYVDHDEGGRRLDSSGGRPARHWSAGSQWGFLRRSLVLSA